MIKIIMACLVTLLFSTPVFAQAKACRSAIKAHCEDVKKRDRDSLYKCLGAHKRDLNEACKASYQSWKDQEKRQAAYARDHIEECTVEEKRYCRNVEPGNGRLRSCLRLHKHKLSSTCQEVLKKKLLFY